LRVQGRSSMSAGFSFEATAVSREDQTQELVDALKKTFKYVDDGLVYTSNTEAAQLANSLEKGGNITLIPAPLEKGGYPSSDMLRTLVPEIGIALQRTDMAYFLWKFPTLYYSKEELQRWVWNDRPPQMLRDEDQPHPPFLPAYEVAPLWAFILRKLSRWRMAFGLINNRPVYASARANMYPLKYMRVVLQQNKKSHLINRKGEKVLEHLPASLAHLYRLLGVKDFEYITSRIDVENDLKGMYLGSAAGPNKGQVREVRTSTSKIHVSPSGKKFEMHSFDLDVFLRLIRDGRDIPVYWVITPKDEMFFTFDKQYADDKWQKFQDKCRVFVIPSSNFVILERLVSKIRMLKERGPCIRIGHRWSRGGMDSIAKCLGISIANCFKNILCDGDIDKFDMRVKAFFVNLYYSSSLAYEVPGSEDYEIKKKIIKQIIKAIVARITQLFGELWCIQRGGVPSGCYNTSHMDSWVMALYFCLFCVWQIFNAPKNHQAQLEEEFIKIVKLIVYGDDHVYNKGEGLGSTYFSTTLFAKFLEEMFEVELRDHRDGVPFCSTEFEGWLVGLPGMVFLKHYAVVNKNKGEGQSSFVPFRETRDYICRAAWGREPKDRDIMDVMLSVLGHVYGTHGSNYDAYKSLMFFYRELLRFVPPSYTHNQSADEMIQRVDRTDIRKMRQHGITTDDLRTGFPTWENLQSRNVYDASYQDITVQLNDLDDEIEHDLGW